MKSSKRYLVWLLTAMLGVSSAAQLPVQAQENTDQESSYDIDSSDSVRQSGIGLTDGVYTPDHFSWSGGSGRADITCSEITVSDGQAYATIVFGSLNYGYVKVDGEEYLPTYDEETSSFTIPITLNENNTIIGMTTAMSAAHEITYTIYVSLAAAEGTGAETNKAGDDAPELIGLAFESKESIEAAEYFRMYHYEQGVTLIEVDQTAGSELENAEPLRYLIAAEEVEIPVALENEMSVIRTPAESIYTDSEQVLEQLKELGQEERVTVQNETSGSKPDYKELVVNQCDLAILDNAGQEDTPELLDEITQRLTTLGIPTLVDCSGQEKSEQAKAEWQKVYAAILGSQEISSDDIEMTEIPKIEGLTYESTLDLNYAERFDLHYYNDGYAVIDIYGSAKYLVVPEGMPVPEQLDDTYVVLQKPLDHIYLTATSVMALYDALGGLADIKMTGTQASGWYIDSAVEALENGSMLFAGKYSEPDYELLINQECDLAIESTMILHAPKVQEMLEDLGIPVFVEYSNYEQHPLGKSEWIRLFGFLADKEAEAEAFLEKQEKMLAGLQDFENTEKTVAYFYVNTNGQIVVRETEDYIPRSIELAGGRYIFEQPVVEDSTNSSAKITMEEFYEKAIHADYLIYNASIDNPITAIEELLAKNELFADFDAVQNGNVWCTGKAMFQASDKAADFIMDLNAMLTDTDREMTFLNRLQ